MLIEIADNILSLKQGLLFILHCRFTLFALRTRSEFPQRRHQAIVLLIDIQERITAPAASADSAFSIESRVVFRMTAATAFPSDVCNL
jgi:hypothetical protein